MFNFQFGGFDEFGGGHHGGRHKGGHQSHGHSSNGHATNGHTAANADTNKYYDLLGISKNATDADIKKAFRKQAMVHHPDKGGDPEMFKLISKAHEVLSNPEKRALYDEGGEEAVENGGMHGAGSNAPMDIFDLFGFGGGSSSQRHGKRKGEDVVFPLKVTLEDLYNGTSKKLRLTKNIICKDCHGKGGKSDVTCQDCKGHGVRTIVRQIGPGMITQSQSTCHTCKGSGRFVPNKDKCMTCNGEKTVKEKKTLDIFIQKGMRHGEKVVFKGEADEAPDTIPGDVVVVMQQAEHPHFKREGPNLFYKRSITLMEALTGFWFTIPHLDGRTLIVKSIPNHVYKPGEIQAIKDAGMPHAKNPYVRGNLYIEMEVRFPESNQLSENTKNVLRNILPGPAQSIHPPTVEQLQQQQAANKMSDNNSHATAKNNASNANGASDNDNSEYFEEVMLQEVDLKEEQQRFEEQQREAYEDEDEGSQRHHRAGCRQQ